MKKILITGISGFVGSYLAEKCLQQGVRVAGWSRDSAPNKHIQALGGDILLQTCDIKDDAQVLARLEAFQPDVIFHLAALSHVGLSWHSPDQVYHTNISGQIHIFESLRKLGLKPRVVIAGSGLEYGIVDHADIPITEDYPLKPISPYAVSKVTQDLMAYQYYHNYAFDTIRLRCFNLTGPRRSDLFVISAFTKQIAQMEAGLQEPVLTVGDLVAIRDFTDVRDASQAYWLAMEKGVSGEAYNICNGKGVSISDIIERIRGLTSMDFKVSQDPNKSRPSELPILVGDGSKASRELGWSPTISLNDSINDLLDEWRQRVKSGV